MSEMRCLLANLTQPIFICLAHFLSVYFHLHFFCPPLRPLALFGTGARETMRYLALMPQELNSDGRHNWQCLHFVFKDEVRHAASAQSELVRPASQADAIAHRSDMSG